LETAVLGADGNVGVFFDYYRDVDGACFRAGVRDVQGKC
jgi:hypothetical protein